MTRVTIVTVAYNSAEVLPGLLSSLPEDVRCVVVDNGSADHGETRALCTAHGVEFLASDRNIGFGPGCNLGAARATSEFLFFVNPDASLDPGAIEALLAAAEAHPEASGFNPRLREADGRVAFKRRSKLLPKAKWLSRDAANSDRELPVLSGAALFVRRQAFEAIGGFDPKIFLFHEDDDLSLRLATQCGPLRLVTAAGVTHLFGASTVRSPRTAALKAWYMGQSRVYAARKHALPQAFGQALKDALIQLFSPLSLLSARKRAKHWAYLRGVLAVRNRDTANLPLPW
ncbi:MAG: glycosyl transferase [Alphaproteobacteria bacterium MedPE-SWcel]|nr:MAG: glycosyl transferase [Alphaproteobacteria bacterium MedPE-SWcel]